MIVFWIIGILFLIVGLIVSVPNLIKFIKCKEHTTGKIVSIDSSSNGNARAVYEYIVSSSKYTNKSKLDSTTYISFLMESVMLFMIRIIQIILISSKVDNIFVVL